MMFGSWQRIRNILAFPHEWQQPAKTEQWAYEKLSAGSIHSHFVEFLCFPWATLIDLMRKNPEKAKPLLEALNVCPPKKTLVRATICQHIYMKDLIQIFKTLKVTDIYWSHALETEPEIEGINITAFPLFPVNVRSTDKSLIKPLLSRRYLFSFIGAYDPQLYISSAREWIFSFPVQPNALVRRRDEWHFEKDVYQKQVQQQDLDFNFVEKQRADQLEYRETMYETIFSLCPSGAGPNTIRLWESLGAGCIPVIDGRRLSLIMDQDLWEKAILTIPANKQAWQQLPTTLQASLQDKNLLLSKAKAGRELFNTCFVRDDYFVSIMNGKKLLDKYKSTQ